MFNGWGHIQRAVMASLSRHPIQSIAELGRRVYRQKEPMNRSQYESLARALRTLTRDGYIKEGNRLSAKGYLCWELVGMQPRTDRIREAAKAKTQIRALNSSPPATPAELVR